MQTRRPCWGGAFLFAKSLELLLLEALEERVVEEAERIQVGDIFLRKFFSGKFPHAAAIFY